MLSKSRREKFPGAHAVLPLCQTRLRHGSERNLCSEQGETGTIPSDYDHDRHGVGGRWARWCRGLWRPILCVGETAGERRDGAAVIAYEPIWAIGGGGTATPGDAGEMCSAIRDEVAQMAGPDTAAAVRIQDGGSVTPATSAALLRAPAWTGSSSAARAWTPGSSPPSWSPEPDPRAACALAQAKPQLFPAVHSHGGSP
jgi:hypothetical protein